MGLEKTMPAILAIVLLGVVSCAKLRKYPHQEYYGPHNDGFDASEEEKQDLTKIPGEPGVDYPLYHSVPQTSFSCNSVPAVPGIYANVETGCQAYHVCQDGRDGEQGSAFLCSNGTLFNQAEFTCDWWYKVDCKQAPELYRLNADVETNPYTPKKQTSAEESDYYKSPTSKYYRPHQPYVAPTPKHSYVTPKSQPHKYYQEEYSQY